MHRILMINDSIHMIKSLNVQSHWEAREFQMWIHKQESQTTFYSIIIELDDQLYVVN